MAPPFRPTGPLAGLPDRRPILRADTARLGQRRLPRVVAAFVPTEKPDLKTPVRLADVVQPAGKRQVRRHALQAAHVGKAPGQLAHTITMVLDLDCLPRHRGRVDRLALAGGGE